MVVCISHGLFLQLTKCEVCSVVVVRAVVMLVYCFDFLSRCIGFVYSVLYWAKLN